MNDRFRMLPSYHYEDSADGKLEKSVGKPLRDYKIEGNCIQNGTPTPEAPVEVECVGERTINLFNPEEVIAKFDSGDTYTNKSYTCVFIQLKPNTTYYLKTFNPTGMVGTFYMANTEQVNKGMPGTISLLDDSGRTYPRGFEKTSTTDDTGRLYIGHYALGTTDERTRILRENQIQVVEGSYTAETAPSYEPYGCKLPIITRGKNLIDFGEVLDKNLYIASQYGTGMAPSSTGGTWRHSGYTEVTEGMTYKFEANNRNASAAGHAWYDSSKTYISGISSTEANEQNGVLTAPEGACYVRLSWTIDEGYNPDYVNTVKFYEGEPKTYNIYLDEPLRKVGDYADYVDFKNGKVVRNVTESVLTGDEVDWGLPGSKIKGYASYRTSKIFQRVPVESFLCSHFETKPQTLYADVSNHKNIATTYYDTAQLIINVSNDIADSQSQTDTTAWISWLKEQNEQGKPVTITHILTTPTETPIVLPEVLTKKGTNVISIGTTTKPSTTIYQYYKGGS